MAKSSNKKPGEPKCRACHGSLEGKDVVRVGGANWHRECAVKAGKKIAAEYQLKEEEA